jgi:hypothetical protein
MMTTLVATIGTRDLMFQTCSGQWYNIGDDQMRGDIIGEQAEVLSDLGQDLLTFRALTQFLVEHLDQYRSRIQPVITGKLFKEKAQEISQVYLIGTNQSEAVPQRDKDTVYACQILKDWFAHQHPHIAVEVVPLGEDGTNPSNFEEMFRWWQRTWPQLANSTSNDPIWLCIKGGVGQTSESGRISGLSRYGDRIQFFEFQQEPGKNRQGIPSDYAGPFAGTSYLWDRTQQQALQLIERYDYAGVYDLLKPYWKQDSASFGALPIWLEAGIAWNRGEFETFFKKVKSTLPAEDQRRDQREWWMAYEQAQLAVVRLKQQNTSEAMLHSFRAVEGLIWEWATTHYSEHLQIQPHKYPQLLKSITALFPGLEKSFENQGKPVEQIGWNARAQRALLEAAIPEAINSQDLKIFWSEETRQHRNDLSHKLGGLSETKLFAAWGSDIKDLDAWKRRVICCLNVISRQTSFKSLDKASLFEQYIHPKVQEKIRGYQPQ